MSRHRKPFRRCRQWLTAPRRRVSLLLLAAAACGASVSAETVLEGFAALRGVSVESRPSWLAGGFGRLDQGADALGEEEERGLAKVHLALDWRPVDVFGVYLHLAGREESSELRGRSVGVVEGYLDFGGSVGARNELRGRVGLFLPPTTQENVDAAWQSPYAITNSAVNTWIGEEVRLSGILFDYYQTLGAESELRLSAGAFGGNDATGALLAWRGWAFGDRLTTHGEELALPPIDSLDTGVFRVQDTGGTTPFGSDLDGEPGWLALARWSRGDRFVVQLTRVDNRGDRELHSIGAQGGEYAWETSWSQLGLTWHASDRWSLVGEWIDGETGMGDRTTDHVQLDLQAWYALVSWHTDRFRVTLRHDQFETVDLDGSNPAVAEINDEDGEAWTLAGFWTLRERWRLGLQILDTDAERPAAQQSGFDPDTDGRTLTVELRYRF